jgi:hypothetical protein
MDAKRRGIHGVQWMQAWIQNRRVRHCATRANMLEMALSMLSAGKRGKGVRPKVCRMLYDLAVRYLCVFLEMRPLFICSLYMYHVCSYIES